MGLTVAMHDGPYFDDLTTGQVLPAAPAITLGPGLTAAYQAICGDPLAVALSQPLAEAVTGEPGAVVNPSLVLQVAIGQSTVATRKVIANLFYRGVRLRRTVRVGETLHTTVTVLGRAETSRRPDRPRRGKVLLGMHTVDQDGSTVVDFQRCALLPWRNDTGPDVTADELGGPEPDVDLAGWDALAPTGWDLTPLGSPDPWPVGEVRRDPLRDTVTDALALVRLTQNQAAAHRDARLGQGGRRLVYGGHTVALAQASLVRLVPSCATVLGWQSCDHTAPVFEDDVVSVEAELLAERPLATGGRLLAVAVRVEAERSGVDAPSAVLDWRPVLFAP